MDDRHSENVAVRAEIPLAFVPFIPDAIMRLSYLYPTVNFATDGSRITITTTEALAPAVERDLKFALYRQKVHGESIGLRTALMEGIMRR